MYTDFSTETSNNNTNNNNNNSTDNNKNNESNNSNNNMDKVLDWGFEDDRTFQAKQNIAMAEMASKCYSY